ncbi:MAG: hypothetical protein OXH39_18200 [Candidatus Poribacteria bacterium]|nr:hypothetical protein [Candidatus Poribacteria bacterium]
MENFNGRFSRSSATSTESTQEAYQRATQLRDVVSRLNTIRCLVSELPTTLHEIGKSSQMPAHYAKAELTEREAIARFKDGKQR